MVRRLKYGGVAAVAAAFAPALAGRLPADVQAIVPVPRTAWRAVRYGVDPALELARRLAVATGVPVVRALAAPIMAERHAGRGRRQRAPVRFRALGPVPDGSVLVDDVVTTGVTLLSARLALPMITRAVTVTAASRVTSLPPGRPPGSAGANR
jgi:predicted amidophosphoribosyltransferase